MGGAQVLRKKVAMKGGVSPEDVAQNPSPLSRVALMQIADKLLGHPPQDILSKDIKPQTEPRKLNKLSNLLGSLCPPADQVRTLDALFCNLPPK